MPPDARTRVRLREALAREFTSKDEIELIIGDAELQRAFIELEGPPEILWKKVLEQAERQGPEALNNLVRVCVRRAPRLKEELAGLVTIPELETHPGPAANPDTRSADPLIPAPYRAWYLSHAGSELPLSERLDQIYVPLHTYWEPSERRDREAAPQSQTTAAELTRTPGESFKDRLRREGVDPESEPDDDVVEPRGHRDDALSSPAPEATDGRAAATETAIADLPRRPLTDLLELTEPLRFLLVGGPGSGKSTFLRHCLRKCLSDPQERILALLLPMTTFAAWIRRRANDASPRLLLEWAGEYLGEPGLSSAELEARSGQGQVLWLLDGLDEIFDEANRARAIRAIRDLFSRAPFCRDRLFVTSRHHAVEGDVDLQLGLRGCTVEIEAFQVAECRKFLEQWFSEVYRDRPAEDRIDSARLLESLVRFDSIARFSFRPFMLRIVATCYESDSELPICRARLLEQIVKSLLEHRFQNDDETQQWSVEELLATLGEIARGMLEMGQVREIIETDFMKLLVKAYHPVTRPTPIETARLKRMAQQLSTHSGLFERIPHRHAYTFPHRQIQEYLAARAYGSRDDPFAALAHCVDDGAWSETVQLTAEYLLMLGASRAGEDFVARLATSAVPTEKSIYRAGLTLKCAAGGPRQALTEPLLDRLRTGATQMLGDATVPSLPEERIELAFALGALRDPRLGMENASRWVMIPPGRFTMGSEERSSLEQPVHPVTFARGFHIGRYPITNEEYGLFLDDIRGREAEWWPEGEGRDWRFLEADAFERWFEQHRHHARLREDWKDSYRPGPEPRFWRTPGYNAPNQPVVGVSWYEAQVYCGWLTAYLEARRPTWWQPGMKVRLCTEAEWEYAARGPANRRYPWGDTPEPDPQRANFNRHVGRPSPVGAYPSGATPEGVADMAGNVWEWVADHYHESYHAAPDDGRAWEGADTAELRVVRGGSWLQADAVQLRAANRSWIYPAFRDYVLGFRVAITSP